MSYSPTSPDEYMKPNYEEVPEIPSQIDSYVVLASQCRQVAIQIDACQGLSKCCCALVY